MPRARPGCGSPRHEAFHGREEIGLVLVEDQDRDLVEGRVGAGGESLHQRIHLEPALEELIRAFPVSIGDGVRETRAAFRRLRGDGVPAETWRRRARDARRSGVSAETAFPR